METWASLIRIQAKESPSLRHPPRKCKSFVKLGYRKSFVRLGYRGERLIEPSSSWFLRSFPQDSWSSCTGNISFRLHHLRGYIFTSDFTFYLTSIVKSAWETKIFVVLGTNIYYKKPTLTLYSVVLRLVYFRTHPCAYWVNIIFKKLRKLKRNWGIA